MKKKPTQVYIEATPNPQTMKFVANYMLVPRDFFHDFTHPSQAEHSPMAAMLFSTFDWVKEVFVSSNYITLTKDQGVEWMEVQNEARNFISEALSNGTEIGTSIPEKADMPKIHTKAEDQEMVAKINEILDEYIKPAVEQDGGAIHFHSYTNGVVKVVLSGSCSGCPSSIVTLKSGIEALLKRALPEVKAVEALDE